MEHCNGGLSNPEKPKILEQVGQPNFSTWPEKGLEQRLRWSRVLGHVPIGSLLSPGLGGQGLCPARFLLSSLQKIWIRCQVSRQGNICGLVIPQAVHSWHDGAQSPPAFSQHDFMVINYFDDSMVPPFWETPKPQNGWLGDFFKSQIGFSPHHT